MSSFEMDCNVGVSRCYNCLIYVTHLSLSPSNLNVSFFSMTF